MDSKNGGRLIPKGKEIRAEFLVRNDNNALPVDNLNPYVLGNSEINAINKHTQDIDMDCWAYVSTSRSLEVAKKFATCDNTEEGYIYVIDEGRLTNFQVGKFEINHRSNKHEQEVLLQATDGNALPEGIIVKKYLVQPNSND